MCVYDGQAFSYDTNEGLYDDEGHDLAIIATDNAVAIGVAFDITTLEVSGTVAVPANGVGDLIYTLALDDQYGMTSAADPTVTLKP